MSYVALALWLSMCSLRISLGHHASMHRLRIAAARALTASVLKSNKMFIFGYFDPENIFLDNEINKFLGWSNRCFGLNKTTGRFAGGGMARGNRERSSARQAQSRQSWKRNKLGCHHSSSVGYGHDLQILKPHSMSIIHNLERVPRYM